MMALRCTNDAGKTIVCADSYNNGVLSGCFYRPFRNAESFESFSGFLLKLDKLLDRVQDTQADNRKSFSRIMQQNELCDAVGLRPEGKLATFELQIVFRQHSSWQGTLLWREKNLEQKFHSVLELIGLMDGALRSADQNPT